MRRFLFSKSDSIRSTILRYRFQASILLFANVAFLIFPYNTWGQSYWARSFGGLGGDRAFSVKQTTDDGFVVVGETSTNPSGALVIKLGSNGNVDWQKVYADSTTIEFEGAHSVGMTTDGGYIVAGCVDCATPADLWVWKLDGMGNIQWQKKYPGSSFDQAWSIQQTIDGGYITAGFIDTANDRDFWVLKLDPNGSVQWQKSYGDPACQDFPLSIQQTSDTGYVVAGFLCSGNARVLKLDSVGNIQWQNIYHASNGDQARDIKETSDGGYVFVAFTEFAGNFDFWLVKLDAMGNIQWQKSYGGINDDFAASVQQTSDLGFILAGWTYSFGAGSSDFWVIKVDSSGNIQWQKSFGGSSEELARSVQQTSDGGYIVVGSTKSFGAGSDDVWVIKMDANGDLDSNCLLSTDTSAVPSTPTVVVTASTIVPVDTTANSVTTLANVDTALLGILENCAGPCLFCDYFEDDVLATDWTYTKPSWSELGGNLIGTPTGRVALAIASPVFSGCTLCSFQTTIQTSGGPFNKVWFLPWYQDKNNRLEVLMKEEIDKWVVRQRINGVVVSKAKVLRTIDPGVFYDISISYDGTDFILTIDGFLAATIRALSMPSGSAAFQAKNTTALFGQIVVN